ncbi:MAG: PDZ domain-containing protein [Verrucomicrobiales bacterium]
MERNWEPRNFTNILALLLAAATLFPAALLADEDKPQSKAEAKQEAEESGGGFLGIVMAPSSVRAADGEMLQAVQVQAVVADSPAAEAGVQLADQIIAVDGVKFENSETISEDLRDTISSKSPGEMVELTIRRGADQERIQVKLGKRPAELALPGTGSDSRPGRDQIDPEILERLRSQAADLGEQNPPGRGIRSGDDALPAPPRIQEKKPQELELQEPPRPQVQRRQAAADRTRDFRSKLKARGEAVRSAATSDEQLVNLVVYCLHLTSRQPDHQHRFDGVQYRFFDHDLNELSPFTEQDHISKTHLISVIYNDRSTDRPTTHLLNFRPKNSAALVGTLTSFKYHLDPPPARSDGR